MQINKEQRAALKAVFVYSEVSGKLYFRERRVTSRFDKMYNTRYAGKVAGWRTDHGYIRCVVDVAGLKKMLYAHQIIFALKRGYIPESVDHINGVRTDNLWKNLRASTAKLQPMNTGKRKNNKSGHKGVSWAKRNDCWRMDIQASGRKYHSYHKTKREAVAAYKCASKELHGKWGRTDARIS